MNMKLNTETLIEELRTTILWDNVWSYIESVEEANRLLQQPDLKGNGCTEKVDIMDSEDFYVVDVAKNKDTFVIKFEMPFILCVNGKFNIQSIAVGTLTIPDIEHFSYEKYDFSDMNRNELLAFHNIIQISNIEYKDTELLGYWE
ncbi:hypothetical protein H7U28_01220 [Coprobacillus cateniformis]|nr:hypothetical protein [Coprobacillus cateniformis]